MKRLMTTCLIMLTLAALSNIASAAITNGGFETGDLTGWTSQYANDGSNGGDSHELYVTDTYYHSGDYALWGKASIVGDYNPDWTPGNLQEDWARTYVRSEPQDLSDATSIELYLTNFTSNDSHYGWGWGQEVFLTLDDGTIASTILLIDNHEPVLDSFFDIGRYTNSLGSDGRNWYGFDVPISDFPGLDLSNVVIEICWEAINWHYDVQTLWAGAAVDDIRVVPEPATMALLGLGSLVLLRKRNA